MLTSEYANSLSSRGQSDYEFVKSIYLGDLDLVLLILLAFCLVPSLSWRIFDYFNDLLFENVSKKLWRQEHKVPNDSTKFFQYLHLAKVRQRWSY